MIYLLIPSVMLVECYKINIENQSSVTHQRGEPTSELKFYLSVPKKFYSQKAPSVTIQIVTSTNLPSSLPEVSGLRPSVLTYFRFRPQGLIGLAALGRTGLD